MPHEYLLSFFVDEVLSTGFRGLQGEAKKNKRAAVLKRLQREVNSKPAIYGARLVGEGRAQCWKIRYPAILREFCEKTFSGNERYAARSVPKSINSQLVFGDAAISLLPEDRTPEGIAHLMVRLNRTEAELERCKAELETYRTRELELRAKLKQAGKQGGRGNVK